MTGVVRYLPIASDKYNIQMIQKDVVVHLADCAPYIKHYTRHNGKIFLFIGDRGDVMCNYKRMPHSPSQLGITLTLSLRQTIAKCCS